MSIRTHREDQSGKATYGIEGDEGTGLHSSADGSASIMAGGVESMIATATELILQAGGTSLVGAGLTSAMRFAKFEVVALTAANACLSWQNPESVAIYATLVIDLTTVATAACTIDFGATSVSSSTSSDTFMDGLDVNAATGAFSPLIAAHRGTNGVPFQRIAAGKWITGTKASGAITGLVGKAIIGWIPLA